MKKRYVSGAEIYTKVNIGQHLLVDCNINPGLKFFKIIYIFKFVCFRNEAHMQEQGITGITLILYFNGIRIYKLYNFLFWRTKWSFCQH